MKALASAGQSINEWEDQMNHGNRERSFESGRVKDRGRSYCDSLEG